MKNKRLWYLMMRLKILFLFLFLISATHSVWANQRIFCFNLQNVSLEDALIHVRKQSGYNFIFNHNDLSGYKISANIESGTLEDVLSVLLKDKPLAYKIKDKVVTVVYVNDEVKEFQTISGVIKDVKGNPIPGATISIKGTSVGVSSDMDGKFKLTVPTHNAVLIFSFVGMKTQLVKVDGKKDLVVVMQDDLIEMDAVIVTGYQTINPHQNVGVATKIKAEDLDLGDATKSIEQMLEGKVAGMVIANPSGAIGQKQKVRVRGTSSILGNREPVWVVDGMIQEDPIPFKTSDFNSIADGSGESSDMIKDFVGNSISWLNPNDIESITVLKDVASTVLYGVKAANGVIVITTKQGKVGRTSIGYTGGVTVTSKIGYNELYMMNSQDRLDVTREIITSGRNMGTTLNQFGLEYLYHQYLNGNIEFDAFNNQANKLRNQNTDWLDILTENSISQKHSVNVSGGNEYARYYGSIFTNINKGKVKGNESTDYGANLTLNNWIKKNVLAFNIALRANYKTTDGFNGTDGYSYASKASRILPAYEDDGSLFYHINESRYLYNQINEQDNRKNSNKTSVVNMTSSLDWTIVKGLKFQNALGVSFTDTEGVAYATEYSNYISKIREYEYGTKTSLDREYMFSELPLGGELTKVVSKNLNWTYRSQLNYNKAFSGNKETHSLGFSLGFEMRSSKYEGYDRKTYGYMHYSGRVISLPPMQILQSVSTGSYIDNPIYKKMYDKITDTRSNYISGYANVSYSCGDRYTLTGSIRSDASNKFGQSEKSKFLPLFSLGARWNIASEPWMSAIKSTVNNFSIKGSFGFQGNVAENFGPDLILKYGVVANQMFGVLPTQVHSLPYKNLTWEKTKSYNLGVDVGLFKNRIQLGFNYYKKRTDDVITMTEVAYEWGVSNMPINDGVLTNSGWDMSCSFVPIRTNNFTWNLSFNTAKNYNKIISKTEKISDWKQAASGSLVKDGYPVSTVWGFIYAGLTPDRGLPIVEMLNEETKDYNQEDVTTWLKKLGKLEPDFTGGVSTSLRYKTLSLSSSFTINVGASRWLANYFGNGVPSEYVNIRREANNRWRKPGDENMAGIMPGIPYREGSAGMSKEVPSSVKDRWTNVNLYEIYNRSDVRFVKANFLKCNNISLGYSLPSKVLKNGAFSNVGIRMSVSNPFKIYSKSFHGVDPEVALGGVPLSRAYSMSLSVGF